jgi:ligand-binding SRPBCC domain-containing protein
MREVELSRFVPATPPAVERALTPAAVVEYEGSFRVRGIEETADGTIVTAGSRRLTFALRFESRDDGLYYTQEDEAGPFEEMETRLTVAPEDEGSRVTARSSVSLGLPAARVTDRVAAWKRRGELRRALDALAEDVGRSR